MIATKVKEELKGVLYEDDEEESSSVKRVWDLPVYAMAGVFLSFGVLFACVTLWNKLNAAMRHRDRLQVCVCVGGWVGLCVFVCVRVSGFSGSFRSLGCCAWLSQRSRFRMRCCFSPFSVPLNMMWPMCSAE